MKPLLALLSAAALVAGGLLAAAKSDATAPTFSDDFSSPTLSSKWTVAKGEWKIENGALAGRELAADKHAAVVALAVPNKDSHIRFRFQLDGAKTFNLSLNQAKGHLFRIAFNPNGLIVKTDNSPKDPASKVETIAEGKGKFEAGHWYTADVEMHGDHVSVKTDNGIAVEGSHPSLDAAKPNYRFVTAAGPLHLDDVAVWVSSAR
jgi:hypothetical protein